MSGWKERKNNQTKRKAYLFVFCKGLLLQQIPAQCSSSRSFNPASWSNILFVNFESTCLESCFLVVWDNLEMERFCFEIITMTWTKMIFLQKCVVLELFPTSLLFVVCPVCLWTSWKFSVTDMESWWNTDFFFFNTHENECGMNGHLLNPHERTLTLAFSLGLCRMEHLSNLM